MESAMDPTPLDEASATGEDWPFWRAFVEGDLFLLLAEDARGAALSPRVFPVSDGALVLAFDTEDRMAAFSPVPVPYAALPGRVVAELAAGQGLGLGLNLGSGAASETVLPVAALEWLVETLATVPAEPAEDLPARVAPPVLPPAAEAAVAAAVRAATGLAEEALLAAVGWTDGRQGTLLAFPGVAADDQPALARAVAEALALSGLDAAALDVAFPAVEAGLTASLRRVARRYVPRPEAAPAPPEARGPGLDPARPPILR